MKKLIFILFLFLSVVGFSQQNIIIGKGKLAGMIYNTQSGATDTLLAIFPDSLGQFKVMNVRNPVNDLDAVNKRYFEANATAWDSIVNNSIGYAVIWQGGVKIDSFQCVTVQQMMDSLAALPGGHSPVTIGTTGTTGGLTVTGQELNQREATTAVGGYMPASGMVNLASKISVVTHDYTLLGNGTAASPLKVDTVYIVSKTFLNNQQYIKRNALTWDSVTNKPTLPVISNLAYDAGWNGNMDGASKNSIYDKIESLAGGHNPVTLAAGALSAGLTLTGQELNYQYATAGQNGGLSSTDWQNFNSKAPGSGSANYIQNQNSTPQTAYARISGDYTGRNIKLSSTTTDSTGIIFKGTDRFIHNFTAAGSNGHNTFMGLESGNFTMNIGGGTSNYSSDNTGVGYQSLKSNTTGRDNSGFGKGTLRDNTTGTWNTAAGVDALIRNTTGYSNSALGVDALLYNTTGAENTSVGNNSLLNNVNGGANTAVGNAAMYGNIAGGENVAIGYQSLFTSNSSYNVAIGSQAGRMVIGGNGNTFIGNLAGTNASQKLNAVNSMALGNEAYTTADNQVVIGNSSVTQTLLRGNTGIGTITTGIYNSKLNVGVGATPANALAIQTTDAAQGSAGTLVYVGTGATTGNTYGSIRVLNAGGTNSANLILQSGSGNVGINITPTAYLTLKAGTASLNTAPLKFTAGTNLSTPEAGAVEWDGTRLYISQNTPARKTIAYTSDVPIMNQVHEGIVTDRNIDLTITDYSPANTDIIKVVVEDDIATGDIITLSINGGTAYTIFEYTAHDKDYILELMYLDSKWFVMTKMGEEAALKGDVDATNLIVNTDGIAYTGITADQIGDSTLVPKWWVLQQLAMDNNSTQTLVGTTPYWNVVNGKNATITLTGTTTITFSNLVDGMEGSLYVVNGGSTSYRITFAGYPIEIYSSVWYSGDEVAVSGGTKKDEFSYKYHGGDVNKVVISGVLDLK